MVRLRTGERFDRREGIWTSISLMGEARSVASSALINGRIYIVGGCDGEATNTVEMLEILKYDTYFPFHLLEMFFRYEPRMDEWSAGPAMNSERTNLSVVFDGHRYLYAIGGRSGGTLTEFVFLFPFF